MFTLEMLPADYGDCLWLEYGDAQKPKILALDGGPQKANSPLLTRLQERTKNGQPLHIELLVVTHLDADHIDGALATLEALPASVTFGDIWFNGFKHLVPPDQMGVPAAERLTRHLEARKLPWNEGFERGAVVVDREGALPVKVLNGGLKLTLLSPTRSELKALHKVWNSVLKKSGMAADALGEAPGDETESDPAEPPDRLGRKDVWPPDIAALAKQKAIADTAQANGSSIGLLAEFKEGERTCAVLLGADCFASVLVDSIGRLLAERQLEHLRLDAFKLPHHGSRFNLNNSLLALLKCSRYLISTSGARFKHPDHEALARVLQHGGNKPELLFNYDVATTQGWKNPPNKAPSYQAIYGQNGSLRVSFT
jgi:hypothetical protein